MLDLLETIVDKRGASYVYGLRDSTGHRTDPQGFCMNWIPVEVGPDVVLREPSCIAGHLYDQLGALHAVGRGSSVVSVAIQAGQVLGPLRLTERAVIVLQVAQFAQDRGCTWGEAYGMACFAYRCTEDVEDTKWCSDPLTLHAAYARAKDFLTPVRWGHGQDEPAGF